MTDSCQGDWEYMDKLVNRFLSWTLPKSVCSDTCVSDPNYQHARYGTNLLTADEAKEMLEHVLEMTDSCQKGEQINTNDIKKPFEEIEHFLSYSFSCVHPSEEVDYIR